MRDDFDGEREERDQHGEPREPREHSRRPSAATTTSPAGWSRSAPPRSATPPAARPAATTAATARSRCEQRADETVNRSLKTDSRLEAPVQLVELEGRVRNRSQEDPVEAESRDGLQLEHAKNAAQGGLHGNSRVSRGRASADRSNGGEPRSANVVELQAEDQQPDRRRTRTGQRPEGSRRSSARAPAARAEREQRHEQARDRLRGRIASSAACLVGGLRGMISLTIGDRAMGLVSVDRDPRPARSRQVRRSLHRLETVTPPSRTPRRPSRSSRSSPGRCCPRTTPPCRAAGRRAAPSSAR